MSEFKIPQPSTINSILESDFKHKEINDDLGFTGEYSLCQKDILDIIITLSEATS